MEDKATHREDSKIEKLVRAFYLKIYWNLGRGPWILFMVTSGVSTSTQGSMLYKSWELWAFCSFPYRICTWVPCLINKSSLKNLYLLVLPRFLSSCKNICICIFLCLGFVCAQIGLVERPSLVVVGSSLVPLISISYFLQPFNRPIASYWAWT